MLLRPQAQLASSLVLGWFSACVSWFPADVFLDRLINPRYECSPLPLC